MHAPSAPALPDDVDRRHPLRHVGLAHGAQAWREAGPADAPALVLLHGIGSGSGSWAGQLDAWAPTHRVIAWDAPGYGTSSPLAADAPAEADYAGALATLLERLAVRELVLVGHSLGALVAGAWAARPTARLRALVLASPARGYGSAPPEVRAAKERERIELIERLGPAGLAATRSAGLCAPGASVAVVERVRAQMARVTPRGYAQAAHLLAHGNLVASLAGVQAPVHVIWGALDRVTPPEACRAVADAARAVTRTELPGVAHACYVEAPAAFDAALRPVLVQTLNGDAC